MIEELKKIITNGSDDKLIILQEFIKKNKISKTCKHKYSLDYHLPKIIREKWPTLSDREKFIALLGATVQSRIEIKNESFKHKY